MGKRFCEQCGGVLIGQQRKFCSDKCKRVFHYRKRVGRDDWDARHCQHCGGIIQHETHGLARYCSDACRLVRTRKPVLEACERCGGPLPDGRRATRRFCETCKRERELTRPKRPKKSTFVPRTTCEECGVPIEQTPNGRRIFCEVCNYKHRRESDRRSHKSQHARNWRKELDRAHPERRMFAAAKQRAKKYRIPFSITVGDIDVPDRCPILGIELVHGDGQTTDSSPSLDRIVPELGYVPGNIAVVSLRANQIKNNGTALEHRKIAEWMDHMAQMTLAVA